MTAVLISIHPEYCIKIANRDKLLEIRKNAPKVPMPFKCYIYCTKNNTHIRCSRNCEYFGMQEMYGYCGECPYIDGIGKVIGEFVCNSISCIPPTGLVDVVDCEMSCLTAEEIIEYSGGKILYGWHISDLVIYDKPREIGEFTKVYRGGVLCHMDRAPQSWCYVNEVKYERR